MSTLSGTVSKFLRRAFFVGALAVCSMLVGTQASHADNQAKLAEAMAFLKSETAKLGAPSVTDGVLSFGSTKINDDHTIVDEVKAKFGATATLFAVNGTNYTRVATNVVKDGNRAVGTNLDPSGPAYAAVKSDKTFYGIVEILGKMFDTGYEPIKNDAGEIIGVYFVGYAAE